MIIILERKTTEFLYLYLIVLVLIVLNFTFFAMTAYKIRQAQNATTKALTQGDSQKHSKLESDTARYIFIFSTLLSHLSFDKKETIKF